MHAYKLAFLKILFTGIFYVGGLCAGTAVFLCYISSCINFRYANILLVEAITCNQHEAEFSLSAKRYYLYFDHCL